MDVKFITIDKNKVYVTQSVLPQDTPTCAKCESANVLADAGAVWDAATGAFKLQSVGSKVTCQDCSEVAAPVMRKIKPPSTTRPATIEDTRAWDKAWAEFLEENPKAKDYKLPHRDLTPREVKQGIVLE